MSKPKRTPSAGKPTPPPPVKQLYLAKVDTDSIDTTWRAVVALMPDEVETFRDYLHALYENGANQIDDVVLEPVEAVAQSMSEAMDELGQSFTQADDEDDDFDEEDDDDEDPEDDDLPRPVA